ncbi:hypothetical protein [Paenibacillus sp. 481]|uniref:hypothetical protein n=1 Tax=Paenibacillus sp. 481 TaxID=2835869 RepID=UPI001E5265FA|nr:hypothetical protein [Paenibacillus sp. 481]UHA72177.1 hypothetical protein KIK04_15910 [Paenibacillus sp. 481]
MSAYFQQFGKYTDRLPPTLLQLVELAEELKTRDKPLELSMHVDDNGYHYASTPLDVISFGSNGCDGIHYGFLTDFGTVEHLEEAYIVCVSPMDFGDEVRIVARNLTQFLSLLLWDDGLLCNRFESAAAYEQYKLDCAAQGPTDYGDLVQYEAEQQEIRALVQARWGIGPLDNPFHYIEEVNRQRTKEVALLTSDGLGVVPISKGVTAALVNLETTFEHTHIAYVWLDDADVIELEDVKKYFAVASLESKLAFIRDAQSKGVFDDSDRSLLDYVTESLCLWGMEDEAAHLQLSFPAQPECTVQVLETGMVLVWGDGDTEHDKA